jgi:hypothetical protein
VVAIEADSWLPAVQQTAPTVGQGNCCGIQWSANAQIWFQAGSAPSSFTVEFEVPQAGAYDLSAVLTKAPDYGIHTLAVDDQAIGGPFDGYNAGGVAVAEQGYGRVDLAQGRHTLTLTVTGRNAASSGFSAGVDLIELELLDE